MQPGAKRLAKRQPPRSGVAVHAAPQRSGGCGGARVLTKKSGTA